MARRKTHKKKSHHRRRRVSGMGLTSILTTAAGVAAGAVASTFGSAAVKKSFPSLPAFVPGLAMAAVGVILPKFLKQPIVADIGMGLIAGGALFTINETVLSLPGISGVTPGYRYTPKLNRSVGAPGFMDKPIAGIRDLHAVGALYDN